MTHGPVSYNSSFLIDLGYTDCGSLAVHPSGMQENGVLADNPILHCDMLWIPGGRVSNGIEYPLSRETTSTQRSGRGLVD